MKTKSLKRLIYVFAVMFVLSLTSMNAQAASNNKKVTLVKGEAIEVRFWLGKLTKVTTNKKKVVSVKKKNGKAILTAKKKGKAKIVCKTTRGNITYNINVVNPDLKVSYQHLNGGTYAVTVKNNTSVFFDRVDVKLTLKDKNGVKVNNDNDSIYFHTVGPKNTASATTWILVPSSIADKVDYSKLTYDVSWKRYNFDGKKEKNYLKKVKFVAKDNGDSVNVTSSTSYKGKGGIYGAYTVAFYDANGKLIHSDERTTHLWKLEKTCTRSVLKPKNTASWKVLYHREYLANY